ncbi:Gfo/Idh/MocA family protein, partial [Chloroflexota bacterium]
STIRSVRYYHGRQIMVMKAPLKVALVGCGLIGQWHHIPALLKIRDAKLVAICDKNEDLVKVAARAFNISRYYTDFSEMLGREKLDMVDICIPPQTHSAFSIQAMEAGCHVLVEKPVALSLKEADEMASAAKQNNVKLCTVHNKLFEPVMMKAHAMVSTGSIGDVVGIDIQVLHSQGKADLILMNREHWCHSLPAGIFTQTLPHPIYLATAFLGQLEPIGTYTGRSCSYNWVAADEIRIVMKARKGMGTISYSCNSAQSKTIIDIHGTKKHLRIDLLNSVITKYGGGTETRHSRALENIGQSFSILARTISTMLSIISGRFHNGHHTLIQRFIESIQNNTEPPITIEETREVAKVLDEITAQI